MIGDWKERGVPVAVVADQQEGREREKEGIENEDLISCPGWWTQIVLYRGISKEERRGRRLSYRECISSHPLQHSI